MKTPVDYRSIASKPARRNGSENQRRANQKTMRAQRGIERCELTDRSDQILTESALLLRIAILVDNIFADISPLESCF